MQGIQRRIDRFCQWWTAVEASNHACDQLQQNVGQRSWISDVVDLLWNTLTMLMTALEIRILDIFIWKEKIIQVPELAAVLSSSLNSQPFD